MNKKALAVLFYAPCLALCLALSSAQDARAQSRGIEAAAAEYLRTHESKLAEAPEPNIKRFALLRDLTVASFYAGEKAKAADYARQFMALGVQMQRNPGFGPGLYSDATHIGNIVLGHLALQDGDVAQAKAHLLASARVPGSPVLKSFGPHMLLAEDLIERGEREAAVEYFDLCAKFWELQDGRLDRWKAVVLKGGSPDFGVSARRYLMGAHFSY